MKFELKCGRHND